MLGLTLFIFVMGLVWGSFLNVVIYRTTHGTSPLSGRSKCPKCKKTISWKHNIPLISFFVLRGKCANCGTRISWQYPLVEFLTGVLFVWWFSLGKSFFLLIGQPWAFVQPFFWLIIGMLLLVVFVADLRFGLIPDNITISLFILALGYRLLLVGSGQMEVVDMIRAIISGLILTVFFYGLWYFTRGRGFGFGDVKLAPSLGLLLGWPRTLVATFIAFIVGALVAVVLLSLGRKKMGQTIPFGPFLVVGSVVALLFGGQIWGWYWGLI
jgi:leader peptidase (prepilin peptidase)/N-methyltransferase